MATVTTDEEESPPPTSFSSLPTDVTLNIFARISRIHYPILSLTSKTFPSLLSSREIYATRTLIAKTENCLYLCLKLHRDNRKPRWFTFTKDNKLIQFPLFPYKHPEFPTVVSIGSKIYVIGGYLRQERCRHVFLLNCRSHKWRTLPNMLFTRGNSATGLNDEGKIYVFGGCCKPSDKNRGEIYDPKTESWEPLPSTIVAPDL